MKNIFKYVILLLFVAKSLHAQTPVTIVKENTYTVTGSESLTASESITLKPNTWIKSGSTFVAKIESDTYRALSLSNENYIFTRTYQSGMNSNTGISKNSDVIEKITYFDGFGRPMQNIVIKGSPSLLDIVTHIEYDSIGRQKKEFLPYMDNGTALASYRTGANTNTYNYYQLNFPIDISSTNPNPFSQKQFEASPLNRVTKQAAPGLDWSLGSGHEIKSDFQTNIAGEVKKFNVKTDANSVISLIPDSNITYLPNQLYKNVTKDENWKSTDGNYKTTEEFIDKEEHIVLKKTYGQSMVNGILTNTSHETYYVYDNYGNLTYVLPPLVDKNTLITNQNITSGYDNFFKSINQTVFTGTPNGGGNVSITIANNILTVVFNASFSSSMLSSTPQDLPTTPCLLPDMFLGYIGASQSYAVNITNGKLQLTNRMGMAITGFSGTFTFPLPTSCTASVPTADKTVLNDLCYQYKYDEYNRLVEKKIPGKDWEYIIYDKLDRPVLTQDANLRTVNKWLFTKYDAFNRPAYTGEYVNASETSRTVLQSLVNGSTTLSETRLASALSISGTSVNYSNNAFPTTGIDLFTINYYDDYDAIDLDGADVAYGIAPINAKGLITSSKIRILGTPSWITNVTYYDNKGRSIYNYSKNNYLTLTTTVKTQLDFGGKVLETTSTHKKGSDAIITIVDSYAYDHAGRVLTQKQKINNQEQEVIASNVYDNLSQLTNKGVGGKITQSRLQNIAYNYNVRGWLKGINNINSIGNNLFAFQVSYNNITDPLKKLYNGNISQTSWKTANIDNSLKSYSYTYDDLNRLTLASDNSAINAGRYNESLSYDKNGNITNLLRLGNRDANATQFGNMDILEYTYTGNKLDKVKDSSGSTEGFKDGADLLNEYGYDANGNMKTDANKGITGIDYNYLNLPTSVAITGGTIDYTYDATGVKQRKTISTGVTTDYAGSFVYENNILKQFTQPEGYITYSSGIFNYIYQYKDHLGNVRLSYQDKDNNGIVNSVEIVQENNYYAFGLTHKGYNGTVNGVDNKYKYNGKELQDELGLNFYDYGARNYDPAIGRWMNIDPLAEQSRRFSPYTYALNNPVYFIDVDGMYANPGDFINESGKNIGNDGIDDGKVYVVKTTEKKFDSGAPSAGITKADRNATEDFIKTNSGNTEAFKSNDIAYKNSVEIEGSSDTRQSMVDIVNQDSGSGGTKDANNREYGGVIKKDGTVVESPAGAVSNPLVNSEASIDISSYASQSTFHSHPSGTNSDAPQSTGSGSSTTLGGTVTSGSFKNAPSNVGGDVGNSGSKVNYVFSRGNGTVYIFNNTGVMATMPQKNFVTPKK